MSLSDNWSYPSFTATDWKCSPNLFRSLGWDHRKSQSAVTSFSCSSWICRDLPSHQNVSALPEPWLIPARRFSWETLPWSKGRRSLVCCPESSQGWCAVDSSCTGLRCLWMVIWCCICTMGPSYTCKLRYLVTDPPNLSLQQLETVEAYTQGGHSGPGASGSLVVSVLEALCQYISQQNTYSKDTAVKAKQSFICVNKTKIPVCTRGFCQYSCLVLLVPWTETHTSKNL